MAHQEMVQRQFDVHQIKQARAYMALSICLGVCGLVMMVCTAAEGYGVLVPLLLCVLPALAALVAALSKFEALYFDWRVRRDFEKTCQGVGLSGTGSYLSSWKGIAKYGLLDIKGKGRANGVVVHPKFYNLAGNFEQWSADITPLYGQSVDDYSRRVEAFALTFGVPFVNFERAQSGYIRVRVGRVLVPETYDYPAPVAAVSAPAATAWLLPDVRASLKAVPMAVTIDGQTWRMPIEGQHLLVAGRTGAGKGSWVWSLVFGLENARQAGLVRLWGCDPKRVELALGRAWWDEYADSIEDIVTLLEKAVQDMFQRTMQLQGKARKFTPSPETPLNVIVIDELGYVSALVTDKKLRERAEKAIVTILALGRAVGYSVAGFVQDPRKETIPARDLFPVRVALGLPDEMVDLVLGKGMHEAGALCEQIPLGDAGAGCGYVVSEDGAKPLLVRAAWCSDEAIKGKLGAPVDAQVETAGLDYPAYEQGYVPQLGFDGQPLT